MELTFRNEKRGDDFAEIMRVKSDSETFFTGHTLIETGTSNLTIVDSFDIVEKISHKEDRAGTSYDWYEVKNHYRTQARFTPEKQEEFDKQRADIDFIAAMAEIDLDGGED